MAAIVAASVKSYRLVSVISPRKEDKMTITNTLENYSSETPEATNLTPVASMDLVSIVEKANGQLQRRDQIAGDTPEYPFVRLASISSTGRLSHPANQDRKVSGTDFRIEDYSNILRSDSVAGILGYPIVKVYSGFTIEGGTVYDVMHLLTLMQSNHRSWYGTLSSGNPVTTVLAAMANRSLASIY